MPREITIRGGFNLTACLDGYRVWFADEPVADFPSYEGAVDGLRLAREAQGLLAACLANIPDNGAI